MTFVRTSVMPPYASYLRVYEPLGAFPAQQRTEWQRFIADHASPENPLPGLAEERRRTLHQILAVPPIAVPTDEERIAYVLVSEDETLICPWELRLRSWLALAQLRRELPPEVLAAWLPTAVLTETDADHERWRHTDPIRYPHILTAPWQVPVEWFMVFTPDERMLRLGDGPADRAVGYQTSMAHARRRVARALRTLRRTLTDAPMVAAVEHLGRWLEEFHPRARVELDYGGLALLRDDDELVADHSVSEITAGLQALADGDGATAVRLYRTLTSRWRTIQLLQYAN
jgi:hypothetical protein